MRTGTVGTSAICAARYRRAPATISKPFSVRGRTSKGERTPWLRMDSANSFKAISSKVWRGLVFDSFKRASETLRYSVALMTWVSMMVCSFRAVEGEGHGAVHVGRDSAPRWSGLAANALVRESLCETLQSQVVVPCLCETLVLFMQNNQVDIVAAHDISAPLFHADIIVAVIEGR